jgi:hypothetical protein
MKKTEGLKSRATVPLRWSTQERDMEILDPANRSVSDRIRISNTVENT